MCVLLYAYVSIVYFFFFKQKTAYEMRISDWSSDVCSSDLPAYSRRIRTTVSKTNIPISPPDYPGRCLNHRNEGSLLDADHPANGVLFARRSTVVTPQNAPARRLLKFRRGYCEELAYNALCDLRAINYLLH